MAKQFHLINSLYSKLTCFIAVRIEIFCHLCLLGLPGALESQNLCTVSYAPQYNIFTFKINYQ